jgi:hypothetical protein
MTMKEIPRNRNVALFLTPEIQAALAVLLEADHRARQLELPAWQMAVEIRTLWRAAISDEALCDLEARGYVQRAVETTPPGIKERTFSAIGSGALVHGTCWVLTSAGVVLAAREEGHLLGPGLAKSPHWDMCRC